MRLQSMMVTPEQAADWLSRNRINRPLSHTHVEKIRGKMERGVFKETHQTVAISWDDELLDGQHRLLAIVALGRPVLMSVTFDCDPETYNVLDDSKPRSIADRLRVHKDVASVARLIWMLPNWKDRANSPVSDQVQTVLDWTQPVIEEVNVIMGKQSKRAPAPVRLALVAHLMAGHNAAVAPFRAYLLLQFDEMPKAVQAFAKQQIDLRAPMDRWELAARAWRAFDPAHSHITRILIQDPDGNLREMEKAINAYRVRKGGKEFG